MPGLAMPVFDARIDSLVAANRLRDAARCLREVIPAESIALHNDIVALSTELAHVEMRSRRQQVSAADDANTRARLAYRILQINRGARAPTAADEQFADKVPVFISYSHADAEVADAVHAALAGAGIAVVIDRISMPPGSSISEFVRSSIRGSRATVCLLSEQSLLSGWVTQETLLALAFETLGSERRFIACSVDQRFMDLDFRMDATDRIDAKLTALDQKRTKAVSLRLDTLDIDVEHARLFALRNALGGVLQRLRESLCLDLREPKRNASIARLVQTLLGTQESVA
jgi:hypothetical protein